MLFLGLGGVLMVVGATGAMHMLFLGLGGVLMVVGATGAMHVLFLGFGSVVVGATGAVYVLFCMAEHAGGCHGKQQGRYVGNFHCLL